MQFTAHKVHLKLHTVTTAIASLPLLTYTHSAAWIKRKRDWDGTINSLLMDTSTRLRSKENFREPFVLPSILAKAPRPQSWWPERKISGSPSGSQTSHRGAQASKLVTQIHLMRKYFVRTLILLACWSPNLVILAFGCNKNPHVILWNPSRFSCHSDLKPELLAIPRNCSGFKEGKVKISADLHKLH